MFCPICKDEFRPGFTRCASCDVDLVESLSGSAPGSAPAAPAAPAVSPRSLIEYCGFVSLDDARRARDQLLQEMIGSEIAIRVTPAPPAGGARAEEYWLRVERGRYKDVVRLLGYDEAEGPAHEDEGSFACGECGKLVPADEVFCPGCGARFEDD
jgi:hypothetical protein